MAKAKRRLAAILSADVAGYSRLMGDDERATMETLNAYRDVFRKHISDHDGRVVDTAGDSVLAVFGSVVEAVLSAAEVQAELDARNVDLSDDRRMLFRIGVNLGDVFEQDDGTVYGDGINIAARLESLAEPGGINISGTAFDQVRGKLDFGFDDLGEQEVKNISEPVRAYRVVLEAEDDVSSAKSKPPQQWKRPAIAAAAVVAVMAVGLAIWQRMTDNRELDQATVMSKADEALPMPSGPAIAVLPFRNLSGSPDYEYFSDGVTEDIILGLLKFHELRVIALDTTFGYKRTDVDIREIANELQANYILEGSVQRAGNTIRVSAKLLDAQSASHVWGETYERNLTPENIFAMQDEITSQVIATIADSWGILSSAGIQQARSQAPDNLESYDCLLKVYDFYRSFDPAAHYDVRACLEATVERDPHYADAWGWLANVYNEEHAANLNPRPNPLDRSLAAAKRAVELDSRGFIAHAGLADVLFFRGERESFLAAAEKAFELNPNHATRVALLGNLMAQFGYWERGLALVERGIKLNPDHPGWVYLAPTLDHLRNREFEKAVTASERMAMPEWIYAVIVRASAYGHVGDMERAQANIQQILTLDPDYLGHPREVMRKHNVEGSLIEIVMEGLRKGGLEIPEATAATN